MAKRSPLFQDGVEEIHKDHSEKQAKSLPYIIIWLLIWSFCLSIGNRIFFRYIGRPGFGITTVNPTLYRFLGDFSLLLIILLLAIAFTGSTEIWSTPGVYFDPTPIATTLMMNQLVTRFINYLGPLLGFPIALIFYILDWVT